MLSVSDIQSEIKRLKKEKGVCILAHAYQSHEITETADFVGDSFGLSRHAQSVPQQTLLMCGVCFMAETAKILSPKKRVILSHPSAGCPMAEQFTAEEIRHFKEQHKGCAVVAYINTTAEIKAECDICVTSASALSIVKKLPQKEILFIPDCNLGGWLAKHVPDKKFYFINGGCPVHMRLSAEDVMREKAAHPNALLLVHPEARREVSELADYVGSTTGIMSFAKKNTCKEYIIGTENSIVEHLRFEHPDKRFYPLSKSCICEDMRLTTLVDIYNCLVGDGGEEITVPEDIRIAAKRSIDKMLELG